MGTVDDTSLPRRAAPVDTCCGGRSRRTPSLACARPLCPRNAGDTPIFPRITADRVTPQRHRTIRTRVSCTGRTLVFSVYVPHAARTSIAVILSRAGRPPHPVPSTAAARGYRVVPRDRLRLSSSSSSYRRIHDASVRTPSGRQLLRVDNKNRFISRVSVPGGGADG